ncbi:MAG TPA: prephenate dehydrogenase [Terriglobales bacterium]|jgi:prephenate dehydrogenase
MSIRQITIIGTGLIGGSFGLALKKRHFPGKIVGCDHPGVMERAKKCGAIDECCGLPADAVRGSDVVLLATPVGGIIDLIGHLGPAMSAKSLLTDVGSTKGEVLKKAESVFGKNVGRRFLGGHPMAGKENSGVDFADPELFQGAVWFLTPARGQNIYNGMGGEFLHWVERTGARIGTVDAAEHDHLCAWISHLPQMVATALAATLADEYGDETPLLEVGGRALREMTRISASPYSMWRDIAITNKKNISAALLKLEQRLAHIRENLSSKQLAAEFERAHHLRKISPRRRGDTEKNK